MGLLALLMLAVFYSPRRTNGAQPSGVPAIPSNMVPVDEPAAEPVVDNGPTSEPRGTLAEANGKRYVSNGIVWRLVAFGQPCDGLLAGFEAIAGSGVARTCTLLPAVEAKDGYPAYPARFQWR